MGTTATASGVQSIAIGSSSRAIGSQSTALGTLTTAAGFQSTAIGYGATAVLPGQIAIGIPSSQYNLPGLATNTGFNKNRYQNGTTRVITTDGNGTLGTSFNPENVMSSIASSGAFAAALGATPNITVGDEPFRCGFGGGVYSNAVASSFGCAVKFGRIYLNVAAAYAPPVELETVGWLNGFGTRFGFSFPLGRSSESKSRESLKEELIAIAESKDAEIENLKESLSSAKEELERIRANNQQLEKDQIKQQSAFQMLLGRVKSVELRLRK